MEGVRDQLGGECEGVMDQLCGGCEGSVGWRV